MAATHNRASNSSNILNVKASCFALTVDPGVSVKFLCLSDKCIVHYKCSEYRHKESETTLHWRDQEVKIRWPIKKPILSEKDKIGKNLEFFR